MSLSPRTPPNYVSKDPLVVDTPDALGVGVDGLRFETDSVGLPAEKDKKTEAFRLDPLLIAASIASSGGITRHHYHHLFNPTVRPGRAGQYEVSEDGAEENLKDISPLSSSVSSSSYNSTPSLSRSPSVSPERGIAVDAVPSTTRKIQGDVEVKCVVRTRIPTPHGTVFLHLYHNNRDNKEHLALVVDPAQFSDSDPVAPFIRSRTLDAIWDENETDTDRITRGAYVGRLSETSRKVSSSDSHAYTPPAGFHGRIPAPLVRIHSECFTGETVGSLRCDCGEQLDEAIRRISQPTTITLPSSTLDGAGETTTLPGRGAVVYMRQEGRGIGLAAKLRAYNLQDLGYDTVQANLMLGHGADERTYEVAAAILRDLEMGGDGGEGVRLLTNNPDKVQALESEGVAVVERVEMVPRAWKCQDEEVRVPVEQGVTRVPGATMIGGGITRSVELEKYLHTKVMRMGHLLALPVAAGA